MNKIPNKDTVEKIAVKGGATDSTKGQAQSNGGGKTCATNKAFSPEKIAGKDGTGEQAVKSNGGGKVSATINAFAPEKSEGKDGAGVQAVKNDGGGKISATNKAFAPEKSEGKDGAGEQAVKNNGGGKTCAANDTGEKAPPKSRYSKRSFIAGTAFYFCVFLAVIFGTVLFQHKKYNLVSILIAVLVCVPFFIKYERGNARARETVVIAVMTAISVLSRVIFATVPSFKPIAAIVIITGIAFGAEAGFLTGAMSALISNMFFGQGPWTPFQMAAWGFIGLISGLIFYGAKKPNSVLLALTGIIGGALFSLLMDIWVTLFLDLAFNPQRYLAAVLTSLPIMAVYAASNAIFLLLLTNPLLTKLNRLKYKYGIFLKQ